MKAKQPKNRMRRLTFFIGGKSRKMEVHEKDLQRGFDETLQPEEGGEI